MSPAIPEAVQLIDAQILHHLALVQDLRLQRNALLPISQLPAEILGKIFHEVRGDHSHGRDDDAYFWTTHCFDEPCSKWIAVSHVSRHWRSVAIDDASLWTNPPLKNPKLTMMMLDRSLLATIPSLALKIEELDERALATLMPHIPRVSSLVIPKMAREMLNRALACLPSTAPQLRALSINSLKKFTFEDDAWSPSFLDSLFDEVMVLPDNILCHTPKLRHLQLNNITIKSDSPLLSHLVTLSMRGIPEKSKPTPLQFRSILASTPYLKRLDLKGVCPQQGTMAPVLMEHLEYLEIDETIPRLIFFFTNVSAAHHLKGLVIHVNDVEGSASDLSLLFHSLNQPYIYSVIGTSTDVRKLEISQDNDSILIRTLKIPTSERNIKPHERDSEDDYSDSMCIWITMGIDDEMEDEDDLMQETVNMTMSDLFNNFTWTGLSELELTCVDDASPHILASTFGTIPQLRIIMVDDATAHWVIEALNHRPKAKSKLSGTSSLPLPFAGLRHIDMGYANLTEFDPEFEALRKCVQRRHKCGTPIISLRSDHSRLEKRVIAPLKKYVEHVILGSAEGIHKVGDKYSPYDYDWYV